MRFDILSKELDEKSREVYRCNSVKELHNIIKIAVSNGYKRCYCVDLDNSFCYELRAPKTLTFWDKIWESHKKKSIMNIVLKKTEGGYRVLGWAVDYYRVPDYEQFKQKWRYKMNEIIIEMFPVTKEAVLVDKWFGREIDKPIFKMLIKGKEKELIAEAERLEEAEKKKK